MFVISSLLLPVLNPLLLQMLYHQIFLWIVQIIAITSRFSGHLVIVVNDLYFFYVNMKHMHAFMSF